MPDITLDMDSGGFFLFDFGELGLPRGSESLDSKIVTVKTVTMSMHFATSEILSRAFQGH